jgi:hypothetical protein
VGDVFASVVGIREGVKCSSSAVVPRIEESNACCPLGVVEDVLDGLPVLQTRSSGVPSDDTDSAGDVRLSTECDPKESPNHLTNWDLAELLHLPVFCRDEWLLGGKGRTDGMTVRETELFEGGVDGPMFVESGDPFLKVLMDEDPTVVERSSEGSW